MDKSNNQGSNNTQYMPLGMCIGISIGMAIGAAMGNIPIGMCIGLSVGMSVGVMIDSKKKEKTEDASETDETEA